MTIEALIEHVENWRGENYAIDVQTHIVRDVILSGGTSRNGYHYRAEVLADAVSLYDRKPVFLDHAENSLQTHERSTRDLAGMVLEARFDGERIRGDLQILETDAGRTLLGLIAGDHPSVGMSHVVLAARSLDGSVVERIHEVISVDAVVFPATTAGFRGESLQDGTTPDAEVIPPRQIHPGRFATLVEQMQSENLRLRGECAAAPGTSVASRPGTSSPELRTRDRTTGGIPAFARIRGSVKRFARRSGPGENR